MSIQSWKTKSTKILSNNKYCTFSVDQFENQRGEEGEYYYHSNNHAVSVFVQKSSDLFVMIREYRYLSDKISLGHVQGGIDDGETPEQAAYREVQEEVGYKAATLIKLGAIASAPAFSKEMVDVYLARDLTQTQRSEDPNEQIEPVEMTISQIDQSIENGEVWDSQVLASWLLVKKYIEQE